MIQARAASASRLCVLCVFVVSLAGCERSAATAPPAAGGGAAAVDLVYERTVNGNLDIYMLGAGGERRLTDDPGEDALPRWTRDGRAVIFSSTRSGSWQLWGVPAAGGAPVRLRANAFTEYQADPSPDGKRIAFLSNAEGREALWIMERATGAARALVSHGKRSILGNPHWSPDGGRIVFSSNWRIGHQVYVVDVATGEQTRVSPLVSGGCEPRFSPDGRKVAYVSRGHVFERSQLVEHDLTTGQEKVLVGWPAINYDPVYSPDGAEIAFVSNVSGEYAAYRLRLADGRSWRVTFGPGPARHPDYRPAR